MRVTLSEDTGQGSPAGWGIRAACSLAPGVRGEEKSDESWAYGHPFLHNKLLQNLRLDNNKHSLFWDVTSILAVINLPSIAGDVVSIPGLETKIVQGN